MKMIGQGYSSVVTAPGFVRVDAVRLPNVLFQTIAKEPVADFQGGQKYVSPEPARLPKVPVCIGYVTE